MRRAVRSTAAACAIGALCGVAAADDEAGLHVTLGVSAQYDSNLARLPDDRTPRSVGIDNDARDDHLLMPFAAIDGGLRWQRQLLLAHAGIRGVYFGTYSNYDTHAKDWRATWRGAFAGDIDAGLAGGREEQVTRFEDFIGARRNVLAVRSLNAQAMWRPRPDRRLALYVDTFDGDNSQAARRGNDYRIRSERLEIGASSAQNNEFTFDARHTDGNYPNRTIAALAPVDNSYRQYQANLRFVYNPGGRTRLDLRGGYAWRRHEQVPERNFNARVGHFIGAWEATGKLLFDAEIGRDVDAVEDYDRVFAVTTTQRIGAKFLPTAKLQFSGELRRRKLDYRGDPDNFLSRLIPSAPRADTLHDRTLGATWTPSQRWTLNTSYQWLDRSSNRPGLQFRAHVVQLTSQYQW